MTAIQATFVGLEFIPLLGLCRSESFVAAVTWLAVGALLVAVPFLFDWWS